VVIGKHQSAHRETNTRFINNRKIPVIRRISGGGAVFHDRGNLNFSFILNSEAGRQVDFRKYTRPVIEFLQSIGLNAEFEGKSDIKIGGYKISGNAEHVYHNRVLHHGTLLYDSDLEVLRNSLRTDTGNYATRAVSSNPASVANIRSILKSKSNDPGDTEAFRLLMINWFNAKKNGIERHLSAQETAGINTLAERKYRTWEWDYAYGPEYIFSNRFLSGNEAATCKMLIKEGIIRECEIKGPAFLTGLSGKLTGRRHMVDDIRPVLQEEKLLDSGFDIFTLF
jgi:lipoate-protein ligase A